MFKKLFKRPERLEHIASKDVTDTLSRAMEFADRMKHVVIVYETHEDYEGSSGGIITNDDVKLSTVNYLLDLGKKWIFD